MDIFKHKLSGKSGVEGEQIGRVEGEMTPAEEAWDILKTIILAVAITLVFRMVLWQPFNIPSGSMRPNLLVGDFLIVSKFHYGYSKASLIYPLTRLPGEGRLLEFHEPERGDVVVFKNSRDRNRDYIKRVIGLPGDEIRTIRGVLFINGEMVQRDEISDDPVWCTGPGYEQARSYVETLPNGVSYKIQECEGNNDPLDNRGPYVVPEGHYFMMGDNRDNSQDSRTAMVGYVSAGQIVGKAERLVFSVDGHDTNILQFWKWPSHIRWGRIFDPVE